MTNPHTVLSNGTRLHNYITSCEISLRNPFCTFYLPWTCRQYVRLHNYPSGPGLERRLRTWILRQTISFGRRFLACNWGWMSLMVRGEERRFPVNPLNTQFQSVYGPAYRSGYEPETSALFDRLIPPDGVFFDVGANWGHFSLYVASREGFCGRVHAFEPMPPAFRDLESTVRATRLNHLVEIHNVALSDSDGSAAMILPDGEHSGLATISPGASGHAVSLSRLDSLQLPNPTLIKIDVEGHEAAVLRGAWRTIDENRPMIIFESWANDSYTSTFEPFRILERHGYRFFQPTFAREADGCQFLSGYGGNSGVIGRVTLVLVAFEPRERFLLAPQLNVLACHHSRLRELIDALRA